MGRKLQDVPESINILFFTSFPPIFIVARILFEWLLTALISSSLQDIQREFILHFHQSPTDSLNAFVGVSCFLASFSCVPCSISDFPG